LIIKNLRIAHGAAEAGVDIGIAGGIIVAIGEALTGDAEIVDGHGRLAVPGFVESHIHLDKACVLDRCRAEHGTLAEAISEVAAAKVCASISTNSARRVR
jgi:cytosine deaminase